MRYFAKIGNTYSPKNKLHADIIEFIRSNDRTILYSPEHCEKFRNEVLNDIETLNKLHNRCKPVEASWFSDKKYQGIDDYRLELRDQAITFSIYQANHF